MRAKLVFEKFTEDDDPIHSMGIGGPLQIAGSYLQTYAKENGYHFEMKPISKKDSPIIIIDLPTPWFESMDGYNKPGVVCITKIKYTITHMPHKAPYIYSLRKVWIGYTKNERVVVHPWEKPNKEELSLKFNSLRQAMKYGQLKEKPLNQSLMGRYKNDEIHEMIRKIDVNIKNELNKQRNL